MGLGLCRMLTIEIDSISGAIKNSNTDNYIQIELQWDGEGRK